MSHHMNQDRLYKIHIWYNVYLYIYFHIFV